MRRGIRYSNGALVRPADFRRAIERSVAAYASEGVGSGFYFASIAGYGRCLKTPKRCDLSKGIVTDPASSTVTFHLTAPDPDFLQQLALPAGDAVPASTPLEARLPLPATGPYMIASYDAKTRPPARPEPALPRVVRSGPARRLPGRDRLAVQRPAERATA